MESPDLSDRFASRDSRSSDSTGSGSSGEFVDNSYASRAAGMAPAALEMKNIDSAVDATHNDEYGSSMDTEGSFDDGLLNPSPAVGPTGSEKPLFIGLNMPGKSGSSEQATLNIALNQGYDMITSRITNKKYKHRVLEHFMESAEKSDENEVFTNSSTYTSYNTSTKSVDISLPYHSEICVFPGKHVKNTIALAAPWIELDSKNPEMASLSYRVLYNEIKHADFCAFKYVIVSGPKRRTHVAQYSHSIQKLCNQFPDIKLMLHLPFTEEYTVDKVNNIATPPTDLFSVWEVWNTIRVMCDYPTNLALALQMPHIVPPEFVVSRWFAEPVATLVFTSRTFVRNAKNYPVLPKSMQIMLYKFLKISPFLIIEEDIDKETGMSANGFVGGSDSFLKYLRHLHMTAPRLSPLESYGQYVADTLQKPLQPSSHDLEAAFYEVFELDAVKYSQYEKALFYAIFDRPEHSTLTIAVAGAGRGPLVDCCIRAARAAGNRSLHLYVIEKNPSAIVLLEKRLQEVWTDTRHTIHLINTDIRDWVPPRSMKFDVIVSELLGSFGDNELAPECLHSIQQYLATDGVMIPREYRSYLQPVFTPGVWASARNANNSASLGGNTLEMSYVVFLQQSDALCPDTKLAWGYQHPNNGNHDRYRRLTFKIPNKGVMHGMAGYFEAVLYKDIELSTRPETYAKKSNNLLSWFSLFFPLSEPLTFLDDSEAVVTMWRRSSETSVWYEWVVESQFKKLRMANTTIHNADGRGLSFQLNKKRNL